MHARAEQLVAHALSHPELVGVTPADVVDAPVELRRRDGRSVYEQPKRERWALRTTIDQEAWLLDVAGEPRGDDPASGVVEAVITAHGLGPDQADAVRELLGSQRRVCCSWVLRGRARPARCARWSPPGDTAARRCSG